MISKLPRELQINIFKYIVNRDLRFYFGITPGKLVVSVSLQDALSRVMKSRQTSPVIQSTVVKLCRPDMDAFYWLIYDNNGQQIIWGRPYIESQVDESRNANIYENIRGEIWHTTTIEQMFLTH